MKIETMIKNYRKKYGVIQDFHKEGQCSSCDALRIFNEIDALEVKGE